jgi:pyrroloquinoline quinone biosynthesis protein B
MPSPGLTSIVLGAAAGGGFPQWNCACRLCTLARSGDTRVRAATQVSLGFSADAENFLVVGASPDLRQQILQTPALQPRVGLRHSPIFGVVLVSADIDGIAGLLVLRERSPLRVFATGPVLEILRGNNVFGVLDPALVSFVEIVPDRPLDVGHGLTLTLLPMPGKIPLYVEDRSSRTAQPGPAYAALVEANGKRAIMAPACAEISEAVHARLADTDVLFFDGTLFDDDEMIVAGVGDKTSRRMGHVPMSGPDGSLARLRDIRARRVYVHINNTNPVWLAGSPQRSTAEDAGFEIGYDGMEVRL